MSLLNTCGKYVLDPPDVLLWVQGRATDSHMRSMIRQIYGNPKNWPPGYKVAIIFFTGTAAKEQQFQALLQYEFEQYQDIVQNRYIGKSILTPDLVHY